MIQQIVKSMDRGQVTIPIDIRKKLNITPQTWLWVRLIKDKILMEPVEKKPLAGSLSGYLKTKAGDKKIY